jgi:hypothetical protein
MKLKAGIGAGFGGAQPGTDQGVAATRWHLRICLERVARRRGLISGMASVAKV